MQRRWLLPALAARPRQQPPPAPPAQPTSPLLPCPAQVEGHGDWIELLALASKHGYEEVFSKCTAFMRAQVRCQLYFAWSKWHAAAAAGKGRPRPTGHQALPATRSAGHGVLAVRELPLAACGGAACGGLLRSKSCCSRATAGARFAPPQSVGTEGNRLAALNSFVTHAGQLKELRQASQGSWETAQHAWAGPGRWKGRAPVHPYRTCKRRAALCIPPPRCTHPHQQLLRTACHCCRTTCTS